MYPATLLLLFFTYFLGAKVYSQDCPFLGQKPSNAFPICATAPYTQGSVPVCVNSRLPTRCPETQSRHILDKNPFWYKFTCFETGTLGFIIKPFDQGTDYSWQLFDVTGRNPEDVFRDTNLVVSYNWAYQRTAPPGTDGFTGTAPNQGTGFFTCRDTIYSPVNDMPTLLKGHDYLLLVSNSNDNALGYVLAFEGGTASLVDTTQLRFKNATASCNYTVNIKLTRKIDCNSLARNGTEFSIPGATILSATGVNCRVPRQTDPADALDVDSIVLLLSAPLPKGNYTVSIKNGIDGNTLLATCNITQPVGDQISFTVTDPQPTPMDSIAPLKCAPSTSRLVFKKPISCNSIAANGSDFTVTGPSGVMVTGAKGTCTKGVTSSIELQFAAPILSGGTYQVHLKNGTDGNTLLDECGLQSPAGSLSFNVSDPVSAQFNYQLTNGCRFDTINFSNAGANGITQWLWRSNGNLFSTQQNPTRVFPAAAQLTIKLFVSNGVCTDSSETSLILDDEVRAAFETNNTICPEDSSVFKNTSIGKINSWLWDFGNGFTSTLQTPPPHTYPRTGRETDYIASLKVIGSNGCVDIVRKKIHVLKSCFIGIPNAFTPNGDGLNDFFYPPNAFKADDLDFRVYNRWGGLVFKTGDWTKKWDGKIKGIPQPEGIYVWSLRYTHRDTGKKYSLRGTILLLR